MKLYIILVICMCLTVCGCAPNYEEYSKFDIVVSAKRDLNIQHIAEEQMRRFYELCPCDPGQPFGDFRGIELVTKAHWWTGEQPNIEFLREINGEKYKYYTFFNANNGRLYMFFDSNGICDAIFTVPTDNRNDELLKLTAGNEFEKVKNIDPTSVLYDYGMNCYTLHTLKNNGIVFISYEKKDGNTFIKEIEKDTLYSSTYSELIKQIYSCDLP